MKRWIIILGLAVSAGLLCVQLGAAAGNVAMKAHDLNRRCSNQC